MKILIVMSLFVVSIHSQAKEATKTKDRKPNQAPGNIHIRCEGIKKDNIKIGFDFVLDPIERLVSVTTFENESTGPVDLSALQAPRYFLKRNSKGKLVAFGFKTFNDGLMEDMSVFYSKGRTQDANLQLSYLDTNKAEKEISCRIL